MHTSPSDLFNIAASTHSMRSLTLPSWVLWGVGIAVILTFCLLLVASLFAMAFTSFTAGFLGGGEPWKQPGNMVKGFLFYGLPVGLTSSYVWSVSSIWLALVAGVAVFLLCWLVMSLIESRRRRY